MTAFITLKGVFQLLGLPVNLLLAIIKYFTVGTSIRKYKKDLWKVLKLTTYRQALSMKSTDCKIISLETSHSILKNTIGWRFPALTKSLPSYGQAYDRHSYWVVKQPGRHHDDPILVYLHGGGYFLQTSPEQVESLLATYKLLDPKVRLRTSILLLDYSLVSWGYPIPTQLKELHHTYQNLTARDGNKNITFYGDSSGGNLAVSYTQYLKELADEKTLIDPIYPRNLALISPWVRLIPEINQFVPGKSYYDNDSYDYIRFKYFSDAPLLTHLIGRSNLHSLTVSPNSKQPQDSEDWKNIPSYSDENNAVLVICGEDEVFRDDVMEFGNYALGCDLNERVVFGNSKNVYDPRIHSYIRKASPGKAAVELYVEPWGVHDAVFFFENHLLRKLLKAEKAGKIITVSDLDKNEFFSTVRVVDFLNRRL